MSTALEIALGYIERGWNPVPIPHRMKAPRGDGWQARRIDAMSASQYFNREPANVGVLLGPASGGLTDVDLDCAEAIAVAPYTLPKTGAIFGRASKRASHRLYITDLAACIDNAVVQLKDPKTKAMLIELRIGGGGKGAQTVFPGSTHEGGEAIFWEEGGEPSRVDGSELQRSVLMTAACALMARCWPGDGSRHTAALIVGGFLARADLSIERARLYVEAIAKAAGDPEWRDRRKAGEDAATAFREGKRTYGLTAMREAFGHDIADRVGEWLDYRGGDETPSPQTDDGEIKAPPKPLIVSSAQFVAGFVPPDYLVDGLLQRRFSYSLTARTGDGKTAIALLLAACVARGVPFAGHTTEKGRVLFLAGENPDDICTRWIAMSEAMSFDIDKIDVHFVPGTFKISEMRARITAEVEALGGVSLVIVDTSAAYFEGDDENSNTQQQTHARMLRELVSLPGGPCILTNCHPVKNAADDNLIPRGGGSYIAEVDGNLTALRDDTAVTVHTQGKFRGTDFAPMSFVLKTDTYDRIRDSKGRLIPAVIAKDLSDFAQEEIVAAARGDEALTLEALKENATGLSFAELAKALGWYTPKNEPNRSKAQRTLNRLKKARLVELDRGRHILTPKGRKVALAG
jgi:hypothetical protein